MQCYTCLGAGKVTCPACQGKGSYWKVVGNRNVWEVCYQCGGRRTVTCLTCGGRGTAPDPHGPDEPGPLPDLPPDPALLQLEGSWKALGSRYELAKQNDGYRVTQFNFLGMRIAEGEAKASGNVLTLTVRNKLTGAITADLRLSGNQLTGKVRGLIPFPVTLKRAG